MGKKKTLYSKLGDLPKPLVCIYLRKSRKLEKNNMMFFFPTSAKVLEEKRMMLLTIRLSKGV